MSTTTTNFGFIKPGVNDPVDANQWGYQLNNDLDSLDSLLKKLSVTGIGSSRPSYVDAGTLWVDNSTNPWILYMYDGTNDVQIGTIDTVTNSFNVSGGGFQTVFKSTNTTYTTNAGAANDPDLLLTLKANKKYLIKSVINATPTSGWPNASGISSILTISITGNNDYTYSSSIVTLTKSGSSAPTPTYLLRTSSYFTSNTIINRAVIGFNQAASNTGSTPVNITGETIVQIGGSDILFNTNANLVYGGTSSATYTIDAGSYILYQEIN